MPFDCKISPGKLRGFIVGNCNFHALMSGIVIPARPKDIKF
jgi:hypothetical protein